MDKQGKNKSNKPTIKTDVEKIQFTEGTSIKEFCEKIGIKTKDIIEKLESKGLELNVNDVINQSMLTIISKEFNLNIELISIEQEAKIQAESNPDELVSRPPVVTIMGHVDHGKTTLLDALRQSNLLGKESGGITQHIGAYRVFHKNRSITFIDTPGHEAFARLRARGAKATDIVVLVIAADDGIMPQTKEAINHAKAAGVPIIVAINKIDKADADPDKTKQQLSKEGLLVEDWGGDVISVDISAKEKTNLEDLMDMILLLSDVMEIKANLNVLAQGVILEARLDAKKGPLATVIIHHGVLKHGDCFISSTSFGKVRALFDENGKILKKAEPSMPVEILGFSNVPSSGDHFQVTSNLETAKKISQYRLAQGRKEKMQLPEHLTLDQVFKKIEEGEAKELPLIIKADVNGSVEVLSDILPNLSTDKIKISIVHSATGNIKESDVLLASASNAVIIGYNIKTPKNILGLAKKENVEIRAYKVIYELTKDIKKAIEGLLEPSVKEIYLGRAQIRRVFNVPRSGKIAGCYVVDGKITRNARVRVIRNDEIIHQSRVSSLKHLKENVAEIKKDYECGIGIENFKDIKEGDIIEAFITEMVMS